MHNAYCTHNTHPTKTTWQSSKSVWWQYTLQMLSIRSYPGGHLACWQLYKYLSRTANALRNEKAIFDKAKDIILYRSHDELLATEGYAFYLNPQRQQFFCSFSIYIWMRSTGGGAEPYFSPRGNTPIQIDICFSHFFPSLEILAASSCWNSSLKEFNRLLMQSFHLKSLFTPLIPLSYFSHWKFLPCSHTSEAVPLKWLLFFLLIL